MGLIKCQENGLVTCPYFLRNLDLLALKQTNLCSSSQQELNALLSLLMLMILFSQTHLT